MTTVRPATADRRLEPKYPLTVTVAEAARMLGISRNSAYEAVRRGELQGARLGRRIVISIAALERLLGDGATAHRL